MNKLYDNKKEQFLARYEQTLGNITSSCKDVGIARGTFYNWLKADEEFAERVESLNEMQIDFVESALLKQIKEGNPTSTIFYLKTKGKKRGYIERTEVDFGDKSFEFKIE